MDFDFEKPVDETPLQSIPPNPNPPGSDEPIDIEEDEDVSDGFLDDNDATKFDDRSKWGPSTTGTTTST